MMISRVLAVVGSSPLAWGIHYDIKSNYRIKSVHPHSRGVYGIGQRKESYPTRFIPTRVGYTGELPSLDPEGYGSSPLAWGIHQLGAPRLPSPRFIPTRVGYTNPRKCISPYSCGSSPLAWGILLLRRTGTNLFTVHPHSRGVYWITIFINYRIPGSSPLAWGILEDISLSYHSYRFIPTRVGYTLPRQGAAVMPLGSSPLAWGIPPIGSPLATLSSVHPHSRGVYTKKIVDFTGFL